MTEFGTKIGASIVEGYTVFKTVTLKYIMMNWKNYLFEIVLCLICASCAQEKNFLNLMLKLQLLIWREGNMTVLQDE